MGDTVAFTPVTAGVGTIIFTVTYDDGCDDLRTVTMGDYYSAMNCTNPPCVELFRSTNCLFAGGITYSNLTWSPAVPAGSAHYSEVCVGSSVTAIHVPPSLSITVRGQES